MANVQGNPAPVGNPPKSNMALIIIIVVIGALIILGVAGFFGWRYISNKYLKSTPATTTKTSPTATPTTRASSSSNLAKKTISTDYVIADSNSRVISESELVNLTPWELKVARNEIYARHGRPFVHKDLQCYFATKSWYQIDNSFIESVLSSTETKNIATIQAYEQKTGSPFQSFDSGC
jgi:hypothetical protein